MARENANDKMKKWIDGMFIARLCGVCNEEIPLDHVCMSRIEDDEILTETSYHFRCLGKAPKTPCQDCGKHRLLCNECKE